MRNKNRGNKKQTYSPQSTVAMQDYDLTQSFRRVEQYAKPSKTKWIGEGTNSDQESYSGRQQNAISNSPENFDVTMGVPSWERYNKLEDRLESYSLKNDQDHNALRQEMEGKINTASTNLKNEIKDLSDKLEKRLPIQWYIWTIIALVAFVSMWWVLSYKDVVDLPKDVLNLEHRIERVVDENVKKTKSQQPMTQPTTIQLGSDNIQHIDSLMK